MWLNHGWTGTWTFTPGDVPQNLAPPLLLTSYHGKLLTVSCCVTMRTVRSSICLPDFHNLVVLVIFYDIYHEWKSRPLFTNAHTHFFILLAFSSGGYFGFGWLHRRKSLGLLELDFTGWISFPVSRPCVLVLKGTESTTDGNRRKSPTGLILSSSTNWFIMEGIELP